jgi:hypothetical protein
MMARPAPAARAPMARAMPHTLPRAMHRPGPVFRPALGPRQIARAPNRAARVATPMRPAARLASPRMRPAVTNRAERRALQRQLATPSRIAARDRASTRLEPRQTMVQNRLQRLQQRAERGRLSGAERRTLRRLERVQRVLPPTQAIAREGRATRAARVTPQQALRGRFAANFGADRASRRHDRARWLAVRSAWRHGLHAPYVPWHGPVYWPHAYDDIFHYTFWPDAYEPGYWAYAFDDFYDGIFFPDGAPNVAYAYPGPYYQGADVRQTTGQITGSGRARQMPGRVTQATRTFCAEQAKGITAWPFGQIEQAVRPINNQKDLLADLKKAAADAAAQFRNACPDAVPLTPTGRLDAMVMRLQATLAAITVVRPALAAFYESLEDEQKARFNEIGPDLEREPRRSQRNAANCQGAKASLADLPIERIDAIVQPTRSQEAALTRLQEAVARSAGRLGEACAAATPGTPVGRLDAMQKRIDAMVAAAEDIRPALDAFYASLDDEQKAKFNRLSRVSAQSRH